MITDPVLQRVARLAQVAVEAMAAEDPDTNLDEMLSAGFVAVEALMDMALDASPSAEAKAHNQKLLETRIMELFAKCGSPLKH